MTKLALGTVQFGLDYGVNNQRGKIPKQEVFEILELALKNEIDFLDTAYNYGRSEKIVGEFIKKSGKNFKIISKLPEATSFAQLEKYLNKTLKNLNTKSLYGYLIHDFKSFIKDPKLFDHLKKQKSAKKIKKIGFSLYHPNELEFLLKNEIKFDLVQFPYNIFDQRFEYLIPKLIKRGLEIHIRSVFLQGLLFKKPEELTGRFEKIKPKIEKLNRHASNLDLNISSLCLNFALLNKNIDRVIIGVDNLGNLKENLSSLKDTHKVKKIYQDLLFLKIDDEQIILPTNWSL